MPLLKEEEGVHGLAGGGAGGGLTGGEMAGRVSTRDVGGVA